MSTSALDVVEHVEQYLRGCSTSRKALLSILQLVEHLEKSFRAGSTCRAIP